MGNKVLPDSDYDIDIIPYGIIWRSTIDFHSSLRYKSSQFAGNDTLDVHHVQRAIEEVNAEISQRTKKSIFPELILAFGSGFIGVFLADLITSINSSSSISILDILILLFGSLLILVRTRLR